MSHQVPTKPSYSYRLIHLWEARKPVKKDTYCPVNAPHRRTVKSYHGSESSCAIWLETKNTFIFNLAREGPQGNNTHVTTAKEYFFFLILIS
ncbi:unnamed protein product, partial [Brassica oleracea var. botrytis]